MKKYLALIFALFTAALYGQEADVAVFPRLGSRRCPGGLSEGNR